MKNNINTDEYINKNNRLRKKLNDVNSKYYEDILVYLRTSSLLKDENEIERVSLEILNDILEAQSNGMTAKKYFGLEPKEYLDEILSSIDNNPKSFFKTALMILLISLTVLILPSFINDKPLDLGSLMLASVILTLLSTAIVMFISKTVYVKNNKLLYIGLIIITILSIVAVGLVMSLVHTPLVISLNGTVGIIILVIFILSFIAFTILTSTGTVLRPIIPLAIAYLIIGILKRIDEFKEFLNSKNGNILTIVLILIGFTMTAILNTRMMKKISDKDTK